MMIYVGDGNELWAMEPISQTESWKEVIHRKGTKVADTYQGEHAIWIQSCVVLDPDCKSSLVYLLAFLFMTSTDHFSSLSCSCS